MPRWSRSSKSRKDVQGTAASIVSSCLSGILRSAETGVRVLGFEEELDFVEEGEIT